MARARYIKPTFFVDEELVELPFETRLLFIGLWTLADREGRLEYRPKRIKMSVFPADQVDIDGMLESLESLGKIRVYGAASCRYIAIPGWTKHQKVHHNEPASTIPPPPESDIIAINGEPTCSNGASTCSNRPSTCLGELYKENYIGEPPLPPLTGDGGSVCRPAPDLTSIAFRIHERHPKHRRLTPQMTENFLAAVCMDTPDPMATAEGIDRRHAGWCASDDWRRDGQRYVPSIAKWLQPRGGGWMTEPPDAVEPVSETERTAAELLRELQNGGIQ